MTLLELLKERVNVSPSTEFDNGLSSILTMAISYIEEYTGRAINSLSDSQLIFNPYNVSTVSMHTIDFTISHIYLDAVEVTDYITNDIFIYFTTPLTGSLLQIDYTAGYADESSIPLNLQELILQLAQFFYKQDGVSYIIPNNNSDVRISNQKYNTIPAYIEEQLYVFKV